MSCLLGPPARCPFFYRFFFGGEGSGPYENGLQKKVGTLILTSLLEVMRSHIDLYATGGEGAWLGSVQKRYQRCK